MTVIRSILQKKRLLLQVSGETSKDIAISFHSSGSTSNQWRKLKNAWFPGRICFGARKKSAGPTCTLYLAEGGAVSNSLDWESMDQDLLLLHGQYRSTLVDHVDLEKASHFVESETSLFDFYLPSSYLSFVCSREEFDLGQHVSSESDK